MTPSLKHLVEDHFKPKWWQLFRKQKFHVCQSYGSSVINEVPTKCLATGELHRARQYAQIRMDTVVPNCYDGCPKIMASDPAFFQKLDEYLARECNNPELSLDKVEVAASPVGAGGAGVSTVVGGGGGNCIPTMGPI